MSTLKKHPLAVTVASLCVVINLVQADDQIIGGSDTTSVITFDPQLHDGQKNTIVIGNNPTTGIPGHNYNAGVIQQQSAN